MTVVSESSFFRDWNEGNTQSFARNHFLNLIGAELEYYGADNADSTFKVDGVVFKVLEDPDDGFRSYLKTVDYTDDHDSIFFRSPLALVRIETYDVRDECGMSQANQGYKLVDVIDKHTWLKFGTHNYDDYYPMFIFSHTPKER
jgi:hypothetical protein